MITILDKTFHPFISKSALEIRISEIASQINKDYEGRTPLFIIVLNGAFLFASDLVKHIALETKINFIRLASYEQTQTTGIVKQIIGLDTQIENEEVIILEDIVDTGITMYHLVNSIQKLNPASIRIATLLHKPEALQKPIDMHYVGFEIENRFVVGYGLDYNGFGRNLDQIYVLAK